MDWQPEDDAHFPSLGLPNERLGKISLWAGDKPDHIGGVSVAVVWNDDCYLLHLYHRNTATMQRASSLFEAKVLALAHLQKENDT